MVLLASNAHSKVFKNQICGDKFQKIHFAVSKGFWGTFNCLKTQKILAKALFPNQNQHLLGNIIAGARFLCKNNI